MSYLEPYWKKYRFMFMLGVFFVSIEAICELLQPRIMSSLVDKGALMGSMQVVGQYALLMFAVLAVSAVSALSRNYIASTVSQRFTAEMRLDMFKKIQSLSADGIDSFEGGSLITRMTNDITQIQNFANGAMRMLTKSPFVCVGAIVMCATLNLRTLTIIIPIVIIVISIVVMSMRLAYPRFAKMQLALDKLNTTMREYLAGIRLVKAFRRFTEEERRFEVANDSLTSETVGANNILAVLSPLLSLFVNFGVALILLLGSNWVNTGSMQVGQIMAFITYLSQILQSLTMISMMLNQFVRVRASSERVAAVFSTEPDSKIQETNAPKEAQIDFETISFDNVWFKYLGSTGEATLKGLTFTLNKSETLGVIGSTGSGKSTLAALFMKFYEPSSGEIKMNGTLLASIPENTFRDLVAIVPQTPTLFTGTIRENLLWGKEDASEEEIRMAAKSAEALSFIEAAPDGFNRIIGQGGVNLSGGQKQRVSIARALIRRPQLIILDDCTSALDLVTEAKVKRSLFEMNLATVFITQRISTVSKCDKILVLEAGEQVGFGTHDELMECCSVYQDIYISQIGLSQTTQSEAGENNVRYESNE
jgi:ATP-binding cassette subfamily B protein